MAVSTTAGSKVFVGPVTPLRDIDFSTEANALTDFKALTGWLEVKEASELGEHGDTSNPVQFTSVGDRRVRKLSGSFDAGTMTIGCGRDPLDPGQRAMVAAQKDQLDRAFMVVYADAEDEDLTDSVEYFIGKVQSRATNMGGADTVTMITFNVGINSEILEVVSKPVT